MGLDITAYSNLKFYPANAFVGDHDSLYDEGVMQTFAYEGFKQSTRGLPAHDVLNGSWIANGWAKRTEATKDLSFRAGSYGGYNNWRESLAALFNLTPMQIWNNPEDHHDLPFFELICFSDCEGWIGPEAAADLYGDFVAHKDLYEQSQMAEEDKWAAEYNIRKYGEWLAAFELAMDNGAVRFG